LSLLVFFCRFIVSQFSGFLAFHETFKYDDNDDDGGDDDDDDDDDGVTGRLHGPIVGPTGRSDWSVRPVG